MLTYSDDVKMRKVEGFVYIVVRMLVSHSGEFLYSFTLKCKSEMRCQLLQVYYSDCTCIDGIRKSKRGAVC